VNTGRQRLMFAIAIALLPVAFTVLGAATAEQDFGSATSSINDLQRSYQMDRYTELAEHGSARGENIYFYKCFVCHNHYAKGGPSLAGLFQHAQLTSGRPVNDRNVVAVIRDGAVAMPGFGHSLRGTDIDDLLSYIKSANCCYEADDPPANPLYLAATRNWPVPATLRNGVHGAVRSASGGPLEGIKVQLLAPNGVRSTVATDADGHYEFPAMQAGDYVLRVATPLSYQPFQRNGVRIAGNNAMSDIVLERVPQAVAGVPPGALPPTEAIVSQLSGSELLWSLPGSIHEKTTFIKSCGIGCHDLKEILRNRFDERSWRVIVGWMNHGPAAPSPGSGSAIVSRSSTPASSPDAELVIKWLARVRGPESTDDPYRVFPPPTGLSTHVVITEYELPRRILSVHEVAGDSKGNIWYASHRSPYVGVLDPRTGLVKEYRVPDLPDVFPGTFKVAIDRQDIVWFSLSWAHYLMRLDPVTGQFKRTPIESNAPINAGGMGSFGLAPDGSIWSEYDNNTIVKIDGESGRILMRYSLNKNPKPSENAISDNGRFWAGGAPTMGNNTGMILDIASGTLYVANSGDFASSAARGSFDRENNVWFGGHTGSLIEIVNEIDRGKGVYMRAFFPPTPYFPYSQFYSAMPDKNGEIWSPLLHGRGFVRFNPVTDTWRVYDNAEPSAFARGTWVDNSTTPVTVWYPDYQLGTLVRIQPRD